MAQAVMAVLLLSVGWLWGGPRSQRAYVPSTLNPSTARGGSCLLDWNEFREVESWYCETTGSSLGRT
jgi:hypothetical protein